MLNIIIDVKKISRRQLRSVARELIPFWRFEPARVFFISSFGIYGAAVVPDSGVGNTWQERLAIILKQGF